MKYVRNRAGWLKYPQLIIFFVALCLIANALGMVVRARYIAPLLSQKQATNNLAVKTAEPGLVSCDIVPCVALTFDDGPSETTSPQIAAILAAEHVHATFFIIGSRVAGRESVLRQEYAGGNEIGDHSWSHPNLTTLPPAQVEDQVTLAQHAIAGAGVPAPTLLRPPYGAVNAMVTSHTGGLALAMWNVDTDDWEQSDPAKIDQNLLAHVHSGAIVLMHDIYPATVAALEPAIQALKQQHYQFVTVSQLYNLSPGDQGEYFGHPLKSHE